MIEEKYLDLIQRELDGANGPQESAELSIYLAQHAEARALYDELAAVTRMLDQVAPVDPPAHLPDRIMRALPWRHPRAAGPGFLTLVRERWESWVSARPALVFASGLAAGLIVFALLAPLARQHRSQDETSMTGAMLSQAAGTQPEVLAHTQLELPQLAGEILVRRAGRMIVVTCALQAQQPGELVLASEGLGLALQSWQVAEQPFIGRMQVEANQIRFEFTGRRQLTFWLAGEALQAGMLHVRVFQSGYDVHERVIQLGV